MSPHSHPNAVAGHSAQSITGLVNHDLRHHGFIAEAADDLRKEKPQMYTPGRTVYWLTSDLHNAGVDTDVYGSEEAFEAALVAIMRRRLDSGHGSEAWWTEEEVPRVTHCLEMLNRGLVMEAWAEFRGDNDPCGDPLHSSEDCYHWGETFLAD